MFLILKKKTRVVLFQICRRRIGVIQFNKQAHLISPPMRTSEAHCIIVHHYHQTFSSNSAIIINWDVEKKNRTIFIGNNEALFIDFLKISFNLLRSQFFFLVWKYTNPKNHMEAANKLQNH